MFVALLRVAPSDGPTNALDRHSRGDLQRRQKQSQGHPPRSLGRKLEWLHTGRVVAITATNPLNFPLQWRQLNFASPQRNCLPAGSHWIPKTLTWRDRTTRQFVRTSTPTHPACFAQHCRSRWQRSGATRASDRSDRLSTAGSAADGGDGVAFSDAQVDWHAHAPERRLRVQLQALFGWHSKKPPNQRPYISMGPGSFWPHTTPPQQGSP